MVPLANSTPLALSFLFQRLKWPVPMSRWRTAKEIRNLLNDPSTRASTTQGLLDYLNECKTESEVCDILSIVFLTSPEGRPTRSAIVDRIHHPSLLADILLERIYGVGKAMGGWLATHSGRAPDGFESDSYFEEHKTAHVPPILSTNLAWLKKQSGYPFQQQWAYEWKMLHDKLGTRCTRYPYYFNNVSDADAGIVGQYWQRMREVYLSAYLRTFAYAISKWGLPRRTAEVYCIEIASGIAGLFDVEPGSRPAWLSDCPERLCESSADFALLIREIADSAREDGMRLVSLGTPINLSVQKFAELTVTAHLVTPDYELPPGAFLDEKVLPLMIDDTFDLKGSPSIVNVEEAITEGIKGDEVAVCGNIFPFPFGYWQVDYLSRGLPIPAPYVAAGTTIKCSRKGIDLHSAQGAVISRTQFWNDEWTPAYPKGGSTRCGVATMIKDTVLEEAQSRLGRKLGFFVQLRIWDREENYGDYSETKRSDLVVE